MMLEVGTGDGSFRGRFDAFHDRWRRHAIADEIAVEGHPALHLNLGSEVDRADVVPHKIFG